MPSLKPIHVALAVALALGAASQSLLPASAQVFKSRMATGEEDCKKKSGTFKQENPTGDTYTCTYAHKIDHCVASTGKCTTSDTPAPKPAAAASGDVKLLLGAGNVTKSELKRICAHNKDWAYAEERSSTLFSCTDRYDGVAVNCTKEKDCAMVKTPVHGH